MITLSFLELAEEDSFEHAYVFWSADELGSKGKPCDYLQHGPFQLFCHVRAKVPSQCIFRFFSYGV